MNIILSKTKLYRKFLKIVIVSFATLYVVNAGLLVGTRLMMVIVWINYRTLHLTGSNTCFVSFDRQFFLKLILSLFSLVPKKLFHYHYFFFTTLYYAPGKYIHLRIKYLQWNKLFQYFFFTRKKININSLLLKTLM